jgi:CubicO group peptidase (beta-lactamase class C family)
LNKEVVRIAEKNHLPGFELTVWSPKDSIFIDYHDPTVQNVDTYGIGSSTKLLVAVFILDLIEKDKLSLNDEIGHFFQLENSPKFATITIGQLLNHTSGIQDYTRNPDWINLIMSGNTPRTFQERVQLIDPKLKPLNKFYYSNSNYLFLEKIVEKITGNTYDVAFNQFYEDHGLAAICMSTAVDSTQAFFGQEISQVSNVTATQEIYGYAGDVHTTSQGLLLFMKKVFVDRTILTPASMVQLQKFVDMEPMKIPIGKGEISRYGSGLMRLTFADDFFIGHSGGTLKYQSFLFFNPQDSQIIIAITNSSGKHYNNSFTQLLIPRVLDRL